MQHDFIVRGNFDSKGNGLLERNWERRWTGIIIIIDYPSVRWVVVRRQTCFSIPILEQP